MVMKKFFGWEEATIDEYRDCYLKYGGNFSTHPDILEFQHNAFGIKHRYLATTTSCGKTIGAICIWDNKYLANDEKNSTDKKKRALPILKDELILPLKEDERYFLPVSSRFISNLNSENIVNCFYRINAKREICLVKEKYRTGKSSSIEKNLRKFLTSGGRLLTASH